MPKINWADDDQPRWEPRYRPRRDRQARSGHDPLARLLSAKAPITPAVPERPPLHLIWGEPRRGDPG